MAEKANGKLVRDKIPEIIRANGEVPRIRVLDEKEYKTELLKKLLEEVLEFMDDPSIEERADIEEVSKKIDELFEFTPDDIKNAMLKKREERGGFEEKIYLEMDT